MCPARWGSIGSASQLRRNARDGSIMVGCHQGISAGSDMGLFDGSGRFKTAQDGSRLLRQTWSAWLKALKPIGPWTVPDPPVTPARKTSIGGRVSAMSPKEIHSLVLERAKHGALIDRCGRTVYYIAYSVGLVWCVFPFPLPFFPPEYSVVTALGAPLGLLLLAWAIFAWLKRRLLTDEEMPRQSLSAWLKDSSQ
jgi:hypothetical protein